ncbi:MAG: FkbM family methyltransferase [Candidatus Omnitrophota bacterium]
MRQIRAGKKIIIFNLYRYCNFNIPSETLNAFEHFTLLDNDMIREMKSFLKLSKNKVCFLDVGSLYGIFSLAFTSRNPRGIAYSIEPSPEPFRILNLCQQNNPDLNIKSFQIALGADEEEIRMKYEWQHLVALGIDETNSNYLKIKTTTLDNFIKQYRIFPDIIKIDVEGYEYHVLAGGKRFLKEQSPIICLEVHIPWLERLRVSIEKLQEAIVSLDYKVYDLDHKLIKSLILFSKNKTNFRIVCSKLPLR